MANLVVSLESPHTILMADNGLYSLLQYSADEAVGRSVRFLQGPETNCTMLYSAIKNSKFIKSMSAHVVLYGRNGESKNVLANCSPFFDSGNALIGCLIALGVSEAITIQDALQDTCTARALISAEYPHAVYSVNAHFEDLFGFNQAQMAGRSLRTIHGPQTDSSQWDAMLQIAASGKRCIQSFVTYISSCVELKTTVSCIPVIDDKNSSISSLALHFIATAPSSASAYGAQQQMHDNELAFSSSERHVERLDHAFATHQLNDMHELHELSATSASADGSNTMTISPTGMETQSCYHTYTHSAMSDWLPSSSFTSSALHPSFPHSPPHPHHPLTSQLGHPPSRATRYPTIQPRLKKPPSSPTNLDDTDPRSTSPSSSNPRPVEITPDLLDSLAHLTITAAAGKIGVSTTALKKACRKLGVVRWPYRKDGPAAAAAAARRAAPRDFDEGYVRRLHRKYGPGARSPAAAGGDAAGAAGGKCVLAQSSGVPTADTVGAGGGGGAFTPAGLAAAQRADMPQSFGAGCADAGVCNLKWEAGGADSDAAGVPVRAYGGGFEATLTPAAAASIGHLQLPVLLRCDSAANGWSGACAAGPGAPPPPPLRQLALSAPPADEEEAAWGPSSAMLHLGLGFDYSRRHSLPPGSAPQQLEGGCQWTASATRTGCMPVDWQVGGAASHSDPPPPTAGAAAPSADGGDSKWVCYSGAAGFVAPAAAAPAGEGEADMANAWDAWAGGVPPAAAGKCGGAGGAGGDCERASQYLDSVFGSDLDGL